MAHFEIYLESSGNIFAGGADLIFIERVVCNVTPRGSIFGLPIN